MLSSIKGKKIMKFIILGNKRKSDDTVSKKNKSIKLDDGSQSDEESDNENDSDEIMDFEDDSDEDGLKCKFFISITT